MLLLLGRRSSGLLRGRSGAGSGTRRALLRARRGWRSQRIPLYPDIHDPDRGLWLVVRIARRVGDLGYQVLALDDLAEDRMLAIEVRGRDFGDEELARPRFQSGVRHGEPSGLVEL